MLDNPLDRKMGQSNKRHNRTIMLMVLPAIVLILPYLIGAIFMVSGDNSMMRVVLTVTKELEGAVYMYALVAVCLVAVAFCLVIKQILRKSSEHERWNRQVEQFMPDYHIPQRKHYVEMTLLVLAVLAVLGVVAYLFI